MEIQDARCITLPGVRVCKLGFLSHDGHSQVKGLLWTPEKVNKSPKAIIQITHGMEEHIGRYSEFANYLVSCGFVVCAHDMIGHGLSVSSSEKLSCIPAKEGKTILIEDAHELRKMTASRYAQQTPYFMFGHSMGSYLMRAYSTRYAEGLSGVVLSGSGAQPLPLLWGGNLLARLIARVKGEDYKSSFLEGMGAGAFSKAIPNAQTAYDWLSTDGGVVDAYVADPLCGVPFSAGAYVTLTSISKEAVSIGSASKVPAGLPLLFVSGALDPVGDNGEGIKASVNLLKRAGVAQVDMKLYEGMRHEILNEPQKQEVYADITGWIEGVIEQEKDH